MTDHFAYVAGEADTEFAASPLTEAVELALPPLSGGARVHDLDRHRRSDCI